MIEVKCPLCRKIIGKRYIDSYSDGGPLGAITMGHEKIDHRKASRVFYNYRYRVGVLCKACAREKFPEGKYYTIHWRDRAKGGDWDRCGLGDYGDLYATREHAERNLEAFQARIPWHEYKIKERDI